MPSPERFWPARLAWRLRGALQWPVFAVVTVIGALILDALPPVALTDLNIIEGLLLATFGNLFIVGFFAPFIARRLERRQAVSPPAPAAAPARPEVLRDRVGAALLVAGLFGTLAAGLANIRVNVVETEAREEANEALNGYVAHSGDEELQRNLEAANTIRLGDGYFRTCIPRDDRRSFTCVLIETEGEGTDLRVDPTNQPNPIED